MTLIASRAETNNVQKCLFRGLDMPGNDQRGYSTPSDLKVLSGCLKVFRHTFGFLGLSPRKSRDPFY